MVKPQDKGYRRSSINATAYLSDIHHMRRRGAKSFVDDLVLSRGVVLSRAELFCDLLRLSLTTRRFVRCRRTYLSRCGSERAGDRMGVGSNACFLSRRRTCQRCVLETRCWRSCRAAVGDGRTRDVNAIRPLARFKDFSKLKTRDMQRACRAFWT